MRTTRHGIWPWIRCRGRQSIRLGRGTWRSGRSSSKLRNRSVLRRRARVPWPGIPGSEAKTTGAGLPATAPAPATMNRPAIISSPRVTPVEQAGRCHPGAARFRPGREQDGAGPEHHRKQAPHLAFGQDVHQHSDRQVDAGRAAGSGRVVLSHVVQPGADDVHPHNPSRARPRRASSESIRSFGATSTTCRTMSAEASAPCQSAAPSRFCHCRSS